ncbi:MAG: hypothetical protein LLF89_07005 [Spirochaetaceae bacterium]|nr:hypothetical protein [Spirochaetaceae bacterium]
MTGFLIKKSFFDGWDNLFSLILCNLVHIVLMILFILLPLSYGASQALSIVLIGAGLILMSIWQSVCTFAMTEVSDYRSPGFKSTLSYFSVAWKPGLWMGLIVVALVYSLFVGIPFYFSQKSIIGIFAGGLLFWFSLAVLLASQYYLALEARLGGGFRKNMKKAFIMTFDNAGFSFVLLLCNLLTAVLSILDFFLAPGFTGIALNCADAIKLRLMKYDWLEANPSADRKHIPWDEILKEEKELVGKRTLKGMIFPWKEEK